MNFRTTDPAGNSIVNLYDIRGRKIQTTDPDLGLWTYDYDALGELVKQTDAKQQIVTFVYDKLGRMTQRIEPGLTSTWVWDTAAKGKGKLKSASTSAGYVRTHSYDSLGRASLVQTNPGDGSTLFYMSSAYDAAGRISSQTYPSGLIVKHVYNALGHLAEVRDGDTDALYWQQNAQNAEGRITQETYGNGVVTSRTYEASSGRLLNISATAANGAAVQTLGYAYDTLGNVRIHSDYLDQVYDTNAYDKLNRLTSTTRNINGVQTVTTIAYDALGNLQSKTGVGSYYYGGNPNCINNAVGPHAVCRAGSTPYSYDPDGNLTGGGGRGIVWTAWNMPASLTQSGQTQSWLYGPEHDRYKMTTTGRTTWYLNPGIHQGGHYERTQYASGTIEHRHTLYGGGQPIGEVLILESGGTNTQQTRYFHSDHQGSIATVTDSAGAVLTRYRYDPWGKQTLISGSKHPLVDGGQFGPDMLPRTGDPGAGPVAPTLK